MVVVPQAILDRLNAAQEAKDAVEEGLLAKLKTDQALAEAQASATAQNQQCSVLAATLGQSLAALKALSDTYFKPGGMIPPELVPPPSANMAKTKTKAA